jgi:ABC-2 type transport system permease protein
MMWHDVWAVIRREYVQRVRTKAFVVATGSLPLVMAATLAIPLYFGRRDDERGRRIAIVDETGMLFERVQGELAVGGWLVEHGASGGGAAGALRARVEEGELRGFLVLDQETLTTGAATLHVREPPSALERLALRAAVTRGALELALERAGVEAESLLEGGELGVETLSQAGLGTEDVDFVVAYGGAFVLYLGILMYSVAVMRATLEEKTNRVVEVIVSSMKPWHLMLGKILGVGAVGLTQMSIWIAFAVLLASTGLPMIVATQPDAPALAELLEELPGAGTVAVFVGFFLFGFFMYSGLYACVGALCNSDQEAQLAQTPLLVLIVPPILLVAPVIQDPGSAMATSLSLFPFFSPILMWARIAAGGAPGWQVALSFVLMALAVLAVAWIAGRIYRLGILMTGKRPTVPEIWRWVRET